MHVQTSDQQGKKTAQLHTNSGRYQRRNSLQVLCQSACNLLETIHSKEVRDKEEHHKQVRARQASMYLQSHDQ